QDTSQAFAITEASQDISFEGMRDHQLALMKIVNEDTNVTDYMSSIGAGGSTVSGNSGRIFMHLKPRAGRPHVDEVIQQLRSKFSTVPGINVYLQNPPLIRTGGMLSKSLYQFTLQGPDLQELYHWAPIIRDRMAALDGFQDVTTVLLISCSQVLVDIDCYIANMSGVIACLVADSV